MIWIVLIVVFGVLVWKISYIKNKYQERKYKNLYTWAIKHKDELPLDPPVINVGEWVEIEENSTAPKDGVYLFICAGDNHLLYERYSALKGTKLMEFFQGDNTHSDGWKTVKPLYYYYIPFNQKAFVF